MARATPAGLVPHAFSFGNRAIGTLIPLKRWPIAAIRARDKPAAPGSTLRLPRPRAPPCRNRPHAMAHENAAYPTVADRMSAPPWASKVPLQSATAPSVINESIASRPSGNSARSGMASDLPAGAASPARIPQAAASTMTAHSVAAAPHSVEAPSRMPGSRVSPRRRCPRPRWRGRCAPALRSSRPAASRAMRRMQN